MRIRKNAKISTLYSTNTNVNSNNLDQCLLQNTSCQLNQSPWDIITFPSADSSPSLHQFDDYVVYYDVNHAKHGSLFDSVLDFEREISFGDNVASVKTLENEDSNFIDLESEDEEILRYEDEEVSEAREEIMLCDVRDKKGWQCGKVVADGEIMCDYHITENKNRAVWTTKKKREPVHEPVAETKVRRRTKKRASTSPYEFYYYSGFGPSWGKKRGTENSNALSKMYELAKVACDANKETGSSNDEHTSIGKGEGKGIEPEMSKVRPVKKNLAYIDEDAGKKSKSGKKKRKPIKARSLKSLM